MNAAIFTLGCRLNQYESEVLADQLSARGFKIVPWGGNDVALGIINTCAVTRLAEAKCRQIIRNFIKANPSAFCVITGCYSQTNAEAIAKIKGVDCVVGNQNKLNIDAWFPQNLEKSFPPKMFVEPMSRDDFSVPFVPASDSITLRANLKIQDGCDFFCSYCLIPKARGRARSREFDDIVAEAKSLVSRGVRELVLTGVNIGTYHFENKTIVEIVDALAAIPNLARIRIGSIEPMTIPEDILDRMADPGHPLMPFLHMPIQSACDRILKDMHRHYNVAEYLKFLNHAVARVPALTVGTDIMIGFPGETNEEFAITCDNFMNYPFTFCHVFTYSERAGTSAARRSDQVDVPTRQRRSSTLRALSAKKREKFMQQFIGQTVEVLFENPVPEKNITPAYTPNYLRVLVAGTHTANTLARVKITACTRGGNAAMIGEIC